MNEFAYDMLYLVSEVVDIMFKLFLLGLLYQVVEYLKWK